MMDAEFAQRRWARGLVNGLEASQRLSLVWLSTTGEAGLCLKCDVLILTIVLKIVYYLKKTLSYLMDFALNSPWLSIDM